jgi:hypothetical protein
MAASETEFRDAITKAGYVLSYCDCIQCRKYYMAHGDARMVRRIDNNGYVAGPATLRELEAWWAAR